MLKVVGASWFQTRISTYILVAVAIIGVGMIILGQYSRIENDGIYSATIFRPQNEGYRIDFWGQGNDLSAIPRGVACAYYKSRIHETGWSFLEIETNPKYSDEVQAYAAGYLEGSLTWQLIYHHWENTVRGACASRASLCKKMRHHLHETNAKARKIAESLESEDPFWHMVHLFYIQLDGLRHGWNYGVQRSRQSVSISREDFLWLAMASDLADLAMANNSTFNPAYAGSSIFLKILPGEKSPPLVTFAQNTAAPYSKMLRLMKKYNFAYHVSPAVDAELIPSRSVVMTSYPGALSSQDEHYIVYGENHEMIVAGIPIVINNRSLWNYQEHQVMSPARVMAANRLATNGRDWSRRLDFKNSGTSNRQWITYQPRSNSLWVIEQIPGSTRSAEHTKTLADQGFFACTGMPLTPEIRDPVNTNNDTLLRLALLSSFQKNVTTLENVKEIMAGNLEAPETIKEYLEISNGSKLDPRQVLAFRGDLEEKIQRPFGVIGTAVALMSERVGVETLEVTSGPPTSSSGDRGPFSWSKTFPNAPHIGQPDFFDFESVTPFWAWG